MSDSTLYFIRDENVFLPATKWFEERSIAELNDSNQQYIIASLEDRFQELIEKVNEVKKDFESSNDKIRLAGKIVRTKSYLCTAKAIGDYSSLLTDLDEMELVIKGEVEKTIEEKERLCVAAEELLKASDWKDATEKLRQLQTEFKALPSVPDLKNEEFRERFEKAKDDFFKGKQASFENFELDLLDNLSKKMDLCEKAESMQHSSEWKKTTDAYIALNEEWKKIGMVPKHRVEELWFRFCTAKDIFFARKKEHIGDIVVEQEENLEKKMALIAKAEALKESKQWKETSDEYTKLMEEWKKIGKVPQEKSDEVWQAFLAPKNYFFDHKNNHFSKIKVQLEDNHARKMAIVQRAEEIQNSMDFDATTAEYMEMFEEWKKIGRVPKEYGDEAWERFQKAKKSFFDRKDENREKRKVELSKDIKDRYERNRSYYNRISRDLQREEELLFDMDDRIKNLPVTLRSYEKREEYLEVMEEIKAKVNELKEKAKEMKEKMFQDEREMSMIMRGPRKKEHAKQEHKKHEQAVKQKGSAEKPTSEKNTPVIATTEVPQHETAEPLKSTGNEVAMEEIHIVKETPSADSSNQDDSHATPSNTNDMEVAKAEIMEPIETAKVAIEIPSEPVTEPLSHEVISTEMTNEQSIESVAETVAETLGNTVAVHENKASDAESDLENENKS